MAHIYPRPILRSKSCRYLRSIPEADSLPQALSPERWQAVRSMDIPDLYCWTLGTGQMFPTALRELFSYTGRFLRGSRILRGLRIDVPDRRAAMGFLAVRSEPLSFRPSARI